MTRSHTLTIWGHARVNVPAGGCPDCEGTLPLHHEACLVFERFNATHAYEFLMRRYDTEERYER